MRLRIKLGKLSAFTNHKALYVDWNPYEPFKRWRLQLGNMWMPLFVQKPDRRGWHWAFWGIGTEPKHYERLKTGFTFEEK